nr:cytochrome c oxidase assembly protein [Ramlibacter albus]
MLVTASAHAHVPDAVAPAWEWNLAPWLMVLMAASAVFYAIGVRALWRNAGTGRGIAPRSALAFALGWLALFAALVSPLDWLGGRLFSAHMVQHELLMVVAAPLLVIGRPLAAWSWAMPPGMRRSVGGAFNARPWSAVWRVITDPVAAWALHAIALWAWHIPSAFDAALRSEGWHIAQHASFLVTALLFWWAVLGHDPRSRMGTGAAFASLFTTMLHTSALGALLSLASSPWYSEYLPLTAALGFDPLEDQQLGGVVMWVPGALAYLFAALAVVARLLARTGARAHGT